MTSDIDAINFFHDPAMVDDPHPYLDALRAECPIRREPHQGVYMVTGFEEALEIYNDNQTFSSCISVTGPFPGFPVPLEGDDVSPIIEQYRDGLPFSDQLPTFDPPKHTDHRSILMRLITPKRLKENEEFIAALAETEIEPHLQRGTSEVIGDFIAPFTGKVVADILGVPEEDRVEFLENMLRPAHGGSLGALEGKETMAHTPLEYLYDRFSRYIAERRENPRNDVLSGMANATFPDGTMPELIDVVRVASNVFAAGQETTVRLISSGLLILAENPAMQQQLRENPDLIPNFVEECLRMESPVKGDFRLARTATNVNGHDLPAGALLMVLNAAANRDPRKFECPSEFRVDREDARQHVAFGRGAHTCPGAPLARAEGQILFKRILELTSDIRVSEAHHGPAGNRTLRYVPTFILRGLTDLHLEFTMAPKG